MLAATRWCRLLLQRWTAPWMRRDALRAVEFYQKLAQYWTAQNCPTTAADMQSKADGYARRAEMYQRLIGDKQNAVG